MGDATSDIMNLDLNLGPGPEIASGSVPSEVVNLDDWDNDPIERIREAVDRPIERIRAAVDDPIERIREAVRIRAQQRWRQRQVQIPNETQSLSVELNQLLGNSGNMSTLQTGEGSVTAEGRRDEVSKMCENNNGYLENQVLEKKTDVEKGIGNDGSFFDCNICLDLATDPVVTCCGHLFCWACLYRWLHMYSDAKECPVCKGEVTIKNVTPIYGRGSNTRQPEEDPTLEIPIRPHARRVESLRQSIQSSFNFPVEEMIRRLGSRFDMIRDLTTLQDLNGARETADRTNNFLNRIMTLRGIRAEQNPSTPSDDISELIPSGTTNPETGPTRRLHPLLLRRMQSHSQRSSILSSFPNPLSSAEGIVEAYARNHYGGRNREQPQPVDDRDSFSSIAAVNSESQMDTAMEIDSLVSLSTSSRRRNDASRGTDVDSGDSRAPRRRRLN
ncbi:hypothetical protein K2173_024183 [Erythroxylum novogranatense]|uniref:E3 ubiquitin-protein ligase RMA n=1 Tax=Erythroxylum novogranatense TaxID=1862640 RepID=A0AAV8UFQ4_9ROSI|nr:hypothetical protein K2173_024183 [Erythroxylum novogranatense]